MLLHGSFAQIVIIIFFQLVIGTLIEKLITLYRTAAVYFLSELGTVLFGALMSDGLSVGSSGATFGLCSAFVRYSSYSIAWLAHPQLELA
jgi:membrane associated rhomboid family serine protease